MSESPFSRWSRRKDEARRAKLDPQAQSDEAAERTADTVRDPAPASTEVAPTPEEIAALPKLEELTAESDITGFLRRGVPEALRNAALRRMWLLDPAIRDFPGHARDYDFDWNTPGGVPGNSPFEPSGGAARMVRHVIEERNQPAAGIAQDRSATIRPEDNADGPAAGAPSDKGGTGAGNA